MSQAILPVPEDKAFRLMFSFGTDCGFGADGCANPNIDVGGRGWWMGVVRRAGLCHFAAVRCI